MWLISILLCIVLLILLKDHAHLRWQVEACAEEENWLRTIGQSNIMSKNMLVRWLELGAHNKKVADYLQKRGMHRVAIYGMAEIGELLWEELERSGIEVVCGIDRAQIPYGRKGTTAEDFQEDVDAIIVSAVYYFSEIYDALNQKLHGKVPILGLDEIIYELSLTE